MKLLKRRLQPALPFVLFLNKTARKMVVLFINHRVFLLPGYHLKKTAFYFEQRIGLDGQRSTSRRPAWPAGYPVHQGPPGKEDCVSRVLLIGPAAELPEMQVYAVFLTENQRNQVFQEFQEFVLHSQEFLENCSGQPEVTICNISRMFKLPRNYLDLSEHKGRL